MNILKKYLAVILLPAWILAACQAASPAGNASAGPLRVLASTSILADIAQNVAGERVKVEALVPLGVDPHEYQPTPQDGARIADSQVLIVNGAGYEWWLDKTLAAVGGKRLTITASAGLPSLSTASQASAATDPHYWLDPNDVVKYVENIRDGLAQADPQGAEIYAANAAAYIRQLKDLDQWIAGLVARVQPSRRLLVTNHESLGYFAARYGFTVVGAVIPSVSSDASPTAQDLAGLIEQIKRTNAPAIFLEKGVNPQLAQQIAAETGVKVVSDLYLETLSDRNGPASTYLLLMENDVKLIVAGCGT